MSITENQREILDHTAHRATGGYYCGDSEDMKELVRLELMVFVGTKPFVPDKYFTLTGKGREALKG